MYVWLFFRCIYSSRKSLPDLSSAVFKSLLQKDLVMNICKNGRWGSMRHLPFSNGMVYFITYNYVITCSNVIWVHIRSCHYDLIHEQCMHTSTYGDYMGYITMILSKI